jgi:uncharacterized protein YndB with AHSA1/START domain
MTNAKSTFVYVTYIRTTREKLWQALTDPTFLQQYWLSAKPQAEWKLGGKWKIVFTDGRLADSGEIAEFDPPRRLAIRWRHELMAELNAEGWSLCTMELEDKSGSVKLTITHSMERENSKLIGAVSHGWPQIMSNLKSLLETGAVALTVPDK